LIIAFRRPYDPIALIGAWLLASVVFAMVFLSYGWAAVWRHLPTPLGLSLWPASISRSLTSGLGLTKMPLLIGWRLDLRFHSLPWQSTCQKPLRDGRSYLSIALHANSLAAPNRWRPSCPNCSAPQVREQSDGVGNFAALPQTLRGYKFPGYARQ